MRGTACERTTSPPHHLSHLSLASQRVPAGHQARPDPDPGYPSHPTRSTRSIRSIRSTRKAHVPRTRSMRIPFLTHEHAAIAKRSLEVDREQNSAFVRRTISVEADELVV